VSLLYYRVILYCSRAILLETRVSLRDFRVSLHNSRVSIPNSKSFNVIKAQIVNFSEVILPQTSPKSTQIQPEVAEMYTGLKCV
jgi:hypothetical protein